MAREKVYGGGAIRHNKTEEGHMMPGYSTALSPPAGAMLFTRWTTSREELSSRVQRKRQTRFYHACRHLSPPVVNAAGVATLRAATKVGCTRKRLLYARPSRASPRDVRHVVCRQRCRYTSIASYPRHAAAAPRAAYAHRLDR